MPLLYRCKTPIIGIWKIEETWQNMLDMFQNKNLFADDLRQIQSDNRKCEWLAVRLLIQQLTGTEEQIFHKENGAPFLLNGRYHISISHTKGFAAVILSNHRQPGIDIEYRSERALKLIARFLSAKESESFNSGHKEANQQLSTLATLCWCAKETAYKALQKTEVDFLKHLYINPFTPAERGIISLKETITNNQDTFLIHYLVTPDYILTWKE